MIPRDEFDRLLHADLDGCLDDADRARLDDALASDSALRAEADELRRLRELFSAVPEATAPADLRSSVMAALPSAGPAAAPATEPVASARPRLRLLRSAPLIAGLAAAVLVALVVRPWEPRPAHEMTTADAPAPTEAAAQYDEGAALELDGATLGDRRGLRSQDLGPPAAADVPASEASRTAFGAGDDDVPRARRSAQPSAPAGALREPTADAAAEDPTDDPVETADDVADAADERRERKDRPAGTPRPDKGRVVRESKDEGAGAEAAETESEIVEENEKATAGAGAGRADGADGADDTDGETADPGGTRFTSGAEPVSGGGDTAGVDDGGKNGGKNGGKPGAKDAAAGVTPREGRPAYPLLDMARDPLSLAARTAQEIVAGAPADVPLGVRDGEVLYVVFRERDRALARTYADQLEQLARSAGKEEVRLRRAVEREEEDRGGFTTGETARGGAPLPPGTPGVAVELVADVAYTRDAPADLVEQTSPRREAPGDAAGDTASGDTASDDTASDDTASDWAEPEADPAPRAGLAALLTMMRRAAAYEAGGKRTVPAAPEAPEAPETGGSEAGGPATGATAGGARGPGGAGAGGGMGGGGGSRSRQDETTAERVVPTDPVRIVIVIAEPR